MHVYVTEGPREDLLRREPGFRDQVVCVCMCVCVCVCVRVYYVARIFMDALFKCKSYTRDQQVVCVYVCMWVGLCVYVCVCAYVYVYYVSEIKEDLLKRKSYTRDQQVVCVCVCVCE